MEFLSAAILGGMIYDGVKYFGKVTYDFLKDKLRKWKMRDEDLRILEIEINNAPESAMENEEKFEEYLKQNKNIERVLEQIKNNGDYIVANDNSTVITNPTMNGNSKIIMGNNIEVKEDDKSKKD